jgi:hypothetical protein
MSIFEYGSGGSTTWWANLVSQVVSVEHDREWFQKLIAKKPANVELIQIDLIYGGEYSKKIGYYKNQFECGHRRRKRSC